jgi:hypothetical protein
MRIFYSGVAEKASFFLDAIFRRLASVFSETAVTDEEDQKKPRRRRLGFGKSAAEGLASFPLALSHIDGLAPKRGDDASTRKSRRSFK